MNYPLALEDIHFSTNLNQEIEFYNDEIYVNVDDVLVQSNGRIWLTWLPIPAVRFSITGLPIGTIKSLLLDTVDLYLKNKKLIKNCKISHISTGGLEESIFGFMSQKIQHNPQYRVDYIDCSIVNLHEIYGDPIMYADGTSCRARLKFICSDWKIIVDSKKGHKNILNSLCEQSGYALTHSVRLTRLDGSKFQFSEGIQVLDVFSLYLSFAVGRWIGCVFPVGNDGSSSGLSVMEWSCPRVDPFRNCFTWTDMQYSKVLEDPFSSFMSLWDDEDWREVLQTALHWYLSANAFSGGLEGAIIQAQTALELLSSAVLVEREKWLSNDGYTRISAAERIRLLIHWSGVSADIPSELVELSKLAKSENWMDSADAMTAMRNTITHPTQKNRVKYARHSSAVRTETWKICLWYLELIILKILNYNGAYRSRISCTWVGHIVPIPWSCKN